MPKKKNSGSSDNKILFILRKIGSFFIFLKDKILDFFDFIKDKFSDLFDKLFGKKGYKFGIRYKIILGFVIPIFFIIVVGIASYSRAKQGMRDRYEKSTLETVRMLGSQVDMITRSMHTEVSKYVGLLELNNLSKGVYDSNISEKTRIMRMVKTNILASQKVNDFISNVFVILKDGYKNITTKGVGIDGFFDEYYESIEKINGSGTIRNWIDAHPVIDNRMSLSDAVGDSYLFSYQALNPTKDFAVVIDASKERLQELIDGINLGEGSIVGIVTMNGKEIIHRNGDVLTDDGRPVFAGRDYYRDILSNKGLFGTEEIKYMDNECILFYSILNETGIVIVGMVPISIVTSEASGIWALTLILVVIALIVVMEVAFVISANIQKNVETVSRGLGAVAQGNLTVKVRVNGHDEFVDLADATTNMISNTKNLVAKVDTAAEGVADSAKSVQGASKKLGTCSDDIMRAVEEMSDGMERQKKYADECVSTTDRLSNEIANVSSQIGRVKGIVDETNRLINESVRILSTLGDKARETTKATDSVKSSVSALLDETGKINSFVNVIKNISSQTHLLSLNASIEAARAGESGRGFSVVAEEIRALATESSKSAGEIKKLVDGINAQTDSSVGSVDMAQNIVDEQFELVNSSIKIFDQMKASMDSLTEELMNIDKAASEADQRRVEAVSAVDDISVIINDSASNANTVIEALNVLKKNVDNLDKTAAKLGENMDELKNEVRVFQI